MRVCYDKLFHMMIDRKLTTSQLMKMCGFSANIITRLKKNEYISSNIDAINTPAIEDAAMVEDTLSMQKESIKDVIINEPVKVVSPLEISDKPVMTLDAAAYPKIKKIKVELDNQNNLIFQAEQQRGNFEIELSDLKGLIKLTRKAELQRKIDEKTDYINRLKIGLSNMVRNYGFENMNDFYLSYKESKIAYTDYQQEVESWENSFDNIGAEPNKEETLPEKLARLQKESEEFKKYNMLIKDRGTR